MNKHTNSQTDQQKDRQTNKQNTNKMIRDKPCIRISYLFNFQERVEYVHMKGLGDKVMLLLLNLKSHWRKAKHMFT